MEGVLVTILSVGMARSPLITTERLAEQLLWQSV